MTKLGIALPCILMLSLSNGATGEIDRATKQKELDNACEVAREKKLTPLREQYIEECVDKWKKDRGYCERFYSDYGARMGNRAPLFYDLPECVAAFEYRNSQLEAK
jgi:hypothetical protein